MDATNYRERLDELDEQPARPSAATIATANAAVSTTLNFFIRKIPSLYSFPMHGSSASKTIQNRIIYTLKNIVNNKYLILR